MGLGPRQWIGYIPCGTLCPCLWLVEREGFERAEHLGAAGSEQGREGVLVFLVACDASDKTRRRARALCGDKMTCGERHFQEALGMDYRVVVGAGELP